MNVALKGTIVFCLSVFFILYLQVKARSEIENGHAALAIGQGSGMKNICRLHRLPVLTLPKVTISLARLLLIALTL